MTEKTPSKIRPWLVWGSAGLFTMFQFMLQGSPSVMIPDLISTFGIDAAQVGFLTTYFFYSYIVMQIPSGILVDIFGPKIILIIGCISAATACLLFASCSTLWSAKSSRLLMGLMSAPGVVCTLTLASRWFDAKQFALVVGFTETLCMIGAAIGTIILAYTVHNFGWRAAVFVCGIIGYLVVLMILIFVRNYPPDHPRQKVSFKDFCPKRELSNLITVFKEPQAWIGGLFSGFSFAVIPAFFALWSIPFFMNKYQTTSTVAASIVSIGYLGAAFGGPLLGWFSDRIGRRKIILTVSSFFAFFLLLGLIYWNPHIIWMFIFSFALGITMSAYVIPFAIIGELLPLEVKGKAMGFTNSLTLLIGAPILQPLIGSLLKHSAKPQEIAFEKFPSAFALLPLSMGLAFILSFFIKETYCQNRVNS